jgi:hypothetical protein
MWILSNPLGLWSGGAPALASAAVACRSYSLPPGAVQKDGGTTRIATNDTRLLNAVFQSAGGVLRLWTTNTSAFSWPGDSEARSVAQWYEIEVPTHAVFQQGAFDASGRHYFFPVIQTDIARNAYLTFGRSAADEYGQVRQTGRLVTDAANTLQGSAIVTTGQSAYTGGPRSLGRSHRLELRRVCRCQQHLAHPSERSAILNGTKRRLHEERRREIDGSLTSTQDPHLDRGRTRHNQHRYANPHTRGARLDRTHGRRLA